MGDARKVRRRASKKLKRQLLRRRIAEVSMMEGEDPLFHDPAQLKEAEELQLRRQQLEKEKHDEDERRWLEREAQARIEASRKRDEVETSKVDGEATHVVTDKFVWVGNKITITKSKAGIPVRRTPDAPRSPHRASSKNEPATQLEDSTFGTEQDKNYCSFHLKTGSCRFSSSCRRTHLYPQKSCTLLFRNMYTGPGLAWEHDEGLEYTDEEATQQFEEFYEDVHSEVLKFGELVNFKVSRNGAPHLRGNVYAHYKTEESAVMAHSALSGRFFGGKQIIAEYVAIKKWRHALCGQYLRDSQTCSHGVSCNFLHCFSNPGGEYDWANWDNAPPRAWQRKMASLFGYPDPGDKDDDSVQGDQQRRRRRSTSRGRHEDDNKRTRHGEDRRGSYDDDKRRKYDSEKNRSSDRHGRSDHVKRRDDRDRRHDEDDRRRRSEERRRSSEDDRRSRRHDDENGRKASRDDRQERSSRHEDEHRSSSRHGKEHNSSRHEDEHRSSGRHENEQRHSSRKHSRNSERRSEGEPDEKRHRKRSSEHAAAEEDNETVDPSDRWRGGD